MSSVIRLVKKYGGKYLTFAYNHKREILARLARFESPGSIVAWILRSA